MRNAVVTDWLSRSEWADWQRTVMTGDASARQYQRLCNGSGLSVVLMNAPPKQCGSQSRFVEIAAHLRELGLSAPRILDWEDSLGLMVLEDLGQDDFAVHLKSSPQDEWPLYEQAVDALVVLQSERPPDGLMIMTPDVGTQMLDVAFEWAATDRNPDVQAEIESVVHDLLTQVDQSPGVLSLRDFHAENLVWRSKKPGLEKVGLLDFQDAFITHPTYDLASLVRDARRIVDPEILNHLLRRLAKSPDDIDHFKTAFHVFAVQRNLRILGIFQRLAQRDGKTGYLALVPRVLAHLETDLAAPACANLAPLLRLAFGQIGDSK